MKSKKQERELNFLDDMKHIFITGEIEIGVMWLVGLVMFVIGTRMRIC